jgi:hypothetical protein
MTLIKLVTITKYASPFLATGVEAMLTLAPWAKLYFILFLSGIFTGIYAVANVVFASKINLTKLETCY